MEGQLAEAMGRAGSGGSEGNNNNYYNNGLVPQTTSAMTTTSRDDIRALERAAYTIVNLRRLLSADSEGEEGYGLKRVKVMLTLRNDLVYPAENVVKTRAQQAVNRFSVSGLSGVAAAAETGQSSSSGGYKQTREARMRLVSAATTLYILSPVPKRTLSTEYQPELLLSTLQGYMSGAISASLAAVSRGLGTLSSLERMLAETSARCQDIVALETILSTLRPPTHPLLISSWPEDERQKHSNQNQSEATTTTPNQPRNLLHPLLQSLDTSSLTSYYWRSLASSLTTRVQEIVQRGGGTARALRANREQVKSEVRECVLRGSRVPAAAAVAVGGREAMTTGVGKWEREAAVMVHAVVGGLR